MKKYQSYIDELKNHLFEHSESRFLAQQLLRLHKEAELKIDPLIVELGVDRGQSTRVFLNAIDGKDNAKLISIDIKDCSNAVNDRNNILFNKIFQKILLRKSYKHNTKTSASFLIDPQKNKK